MSDSIRLHREYGVNPTIPVCWWCGKPRNEVALLGAAYKGEAPMHMVIDRIPCDAYAEQQGKGITLVRCTDRGETWTGQWVVMTEDAVRRIFDAESAESLVSHRKGLLDAPAFDALFPPEVLQ